MNNYSIGRYILSVFVACICGSLASFAFSFLTTNNYLLYLISDIVVAFVFALLILPFDRVHFYKYYLFHYYFASNTAWLVGITMLLCYVGLM